MMTTKRLAVVSVWSAWALVMASAVGTACGSEDSTRKVQDRPSAGAGGDDGAAGDGATPAGGVGGEANAGAGGTPDPTPAGAAGIGGTGAAAGAGGAAAGAAGAPTDDCETLDPVALEGVWTSTCNGYSCKMYVAESGAVGNGCTNGQYESGTLEAGALDTLGEGGSFGPYSTKGTLTRTGCDSLTRAYIGQIPPNTGPEMSYSCDLTRLPACAPSLLEALAGDWDGDCGGTETCITTFTVEGGMTSTCSNGQGSVGSIDETGAFSDLGGGGGFPDYSTTGVIALNDCDSFLMPYTYQMPPNQGTKHPSSCSYTRAVD